MKEYWKPIEIWAIVSDWDYNYSEPTNQPVSISVGSFQLDDRRLLDDEEYEERDVCDVTTDSMFFRDRGQYLASRVASEVVSSKLIIKETQS